MSVRQIRRVCVFCGANSGTQPAYMAAASALGTNLAERGVGLIYGGSSKGLMGAVADAALAADGEAIGVIPASLVEREIAHADLTQLHIVDSMHERKALMADMANAFITLPGGFGTLEETFEVLTWTQIGVHRKPLGLLNVDGFYDPLLAFADQQVAAGFVQAKHRNMLLVDSSADALLSQLESAELPPTRGWSPSP